MKSVIPKEAVTAAPMAVITASTISILLLPIPKRSCAFNISAIHAHVGLYIGDCGSHGLCGQKRDCFRDDYDDYGDLLGVTPAPLLSTLKILGTLSCVTIMIPYLDSARDKSKLLLHTSIALLFIIQMQIFSMLDVMTTFGPDRAVHLLFPKLTQTRIISAFGFLEAGELFVMLQVVAGWFIRYIICFFALMELIRLSGLKIRFKEHYVCALTILFSYLFSRDLFDMFKLLDYLLYIQLANFLVIPLILYSIYYFKKTPAQG